MSKDKTFFIPGRKGEMTRLVDGYLQRIETKTVVAHAGHQCGKGELLGKPVTIDGRVIGLVTGFKQSTSAELPGVYTMEIEARTFLPGVTHPRPLASMGCHVPGPEDCPVCKEEDDG